MPALNPGTLQYGDDYMDPSAGDVMGGLVTISNGEGDATAKGLDATHDCLNDGVLSSTGAYHPNGAALDEGAVSTEDDAMPVPLDDDMPLDDAIPLVDDGVIPLEAAALLGGPQDSDDVDPATRQPSPTMSSCTISSSGNCVTPAGGNSPRSPGKGEEPGDQSCGTKPQGKKVRVHPVMGCCWCISMVLCSRTK